MNQLQQIIENEAERVYGHNQPALNTFISGANFALSLDRWVKIEEGLPEKEQDSHVFSEYVLITDGKSILVSYVDFRSNSWWFDCDGGVITPTHWQPLPAPPEK